MTTFSSLADEYWGAKMQYFHLASKYKLQVLWGACILASVGDSLQVVS